MPYWGTLTIPKWTRMDSLKPAVSWLWPSDLDEGPKAVWDAEYARNIERASCWQIPLYERSGDTCAFLMVHATRGNGNDGGVITLSISGTARYDIYAQESFAIAHSNPRRYVYRSEWEEDGA